MQRQLPPFPAVRAFEAAARHLSFRLAAQELCVSQSAVSHQVKHLETFLGCSLFLRHPQGVALTASGERYLGELSVVLDGLAACTARVRGGAGTGALHVGATPAFAARWLVPRVSDFSRRHPGIGLRISTAIDVPDFAASELDIVISYYSDVTPDLCCEPLLVSSRSPVLSAALMRDGAPLRRPTDLHRFTLLRDMVGDQWEAWFELVAGPSPTLPAGPCFEHCDLTLRAAESGQGVALASLVLIERELASGALVRPFKLETVPELLYSMIYPARSAAQPRLQAFREWLQTRVAEQGGVPASDDRPAIFAVG